MPLVKRRLPLLRPCRLPLTPVVDMNSAVDVSVGIAAYLALFAGVGVVFLFANLLVGKFLRPNNPSPEKQEVYECGEPAIGSSFVQFDLRFYVVALLFIIFDDWNGSTHAGAYGCTWIKWVNEIRLVGPDEPATTQMVEFAARTHQTEPHKLAASYTPGDIQTAATPVRVEKRKTPSGIEYRIVGIVWGGTKPVDRLQIRFTKDGAFTPFAVCPTPKTHTMWSLWEYTWKPTAPGTYDIALKVADATVPQRRLTSGYYTRQVTIDQV